MKLSAERGPALRRPARLLAVALLALAGSGCAAAFEGYATAPNGLPVKDDQLRELLAAASFDSAWAQVRDDEAAPRDELLRTMYRGIVAYYAGAYDTAIAELDRAEGLAQDRLTSSASQLALSTVVNDRVVAYAPGSSERMLLHYYGILAGLRAGNAEAAAVEARRLSHILDLVEQNLAPDAEEAAGRVRLRALMHYLSAVAFESYGAFSDADVSYRRAALLDSTLALPLPSSDSGDVVIVLERGFVDHLAEANVFLVLAPQHVQTLTEGDVAERIALGALIAARVMLEVAQQDLRNGYRIHYGCTDHDRHRASRHDYDDDCDDDDGASNEEPYVLRVAWPVFRTDSRGYRYDVRVATDSAEGATVLHADVSSAVSADFSQEKAALLARTVMRSVGRFALGEAAENRADETSEGLGTLVGILANLGSAVVERADTRSWHLLPADISVVRMRLPAGEQPIYALVEGGGWSKTSSGDAGAYKADDAGGAVGAAEGEAAGSGVATRRIALGRADVRAGMVTVLSARIWR